MNSGANVRNLTFYSDAASVVPWHRREGPDFCMVTVTGMEPLAAAGNSEYSSPPIYASPLQSGHTAAGDAYPDVRCGALPGAMRSTGGYHGSKSAVLVMR